MTPEQRARHAEFVRQSAADLIQLTSAARTAKVRSMHQHFARTGHLSHSQKELDRLYEEVRKQCSPVGSDWYDQRRIKRQA